LPENAFYAYFYSLVVYKAFASGTEEKNVISKHEKIIPMGLGLETTG
jgi:hypothetical protein